MDKEKKNKHKKKICGWEVLLPLGIILILFGIAMLIRVVFSISFWALWPFLLIVLGLVFTYLCIHVNHQSKFLFLGSFLIFCGILMLVISSGFTNYKLKQLWPLFSLFLGISLLLTGRYKKKRWGSFQFVIPAISLFVLSLFFALFSLGFIKESLSEIVAAFWPLLFVLAGLCMLVVFYEKQRIQLWNGSKTNQGKLTKNNAETKSLNQTDNDVVNKNGGNPKNE